MSNIDWLAKTLHKTQSYAIGTGGMPEVNWEDRAGAEASLEEVHQDLVDLLLERATEGGKSRVLDDLSSRAVHRCIGDKRLPKKRVIDDWCFSIAKMALHRVLHPKDYSLRERFEIGAITGVDHTNYVKRWEWLELELMDILGDWIMRIDCEIGEYRQSMQEAV